LNFINYSIFIIHFKKIYTKEIIKITKNISFNKKDAPKIIVEISDNHGGNKKIRFLLSLPA
jgi:hypothetical protein